MLRIKGIGLYKAITLKAAFELGERLNATSTIDKVKITSPGDVAELMMSKMKDLEQEHFVVLLLNSKILLLNNRGYIKVHSIVRLSIQERYLI